MRVFWVFAAILSILILSESDTCVAATPPDSVQIPESFIINKLIFVGNKITKERIIQRELQFKEGDTIPSSELEETLKQSRDNLMNTSLFNFVKIDTIPVSGNILNINLTFVERWYIWPAPILELADRNFNAWWQKKDLSRLNYGMFLTWNNFRGRRERLVLFLRFGYDQKYELSYKIPYINKKQTWGIGFGSGFQQNHEISYKSLDNKEQYYKVEKGFTKRSIFAYGEAYHRKGIHNTHLFNLGYSRLQVVDTVVSEGLNPDYSFGSDTLNQFMVFYYTFKSDFRDFRQYPLHGYYFDVTMQKLGFGLFKNPSVDVLTIQANARKYFQIKGKFYWASGLTVKASPLSEYQPYYYQRGLGYGRDYVRGYQYYVIDGQHFGILKNNLKFELLSMREMKFNFIPWEKFSRLYYALYLNGYVDIGYSIDNQTAVVNPLANHTLVGYGIGLDFVTYYDTVWRFEFSVNKMGETGFFISFMPSI
jgi:outer membrane protein assembly factor BamA